MKHDFKIYRTNVGTYYEALNIPHDRAMMLIKFCHNLNIVHVNVADKMLECAEIAENDNEFAFMVFKLGEVSGMAMAFEVPDECETLINDLVNKQELFHRKK